MPHTQIERPPTPGFLEILSQEGGWPGDQDPVYLFGDLTALSVACSLLQKGEAGTGRSVGPSPEKGKCRRQPGLRMDLGLTVELQHSQGL